MFLLMLALALPPAVRSDTAGIYLTAADFQRHQLAYPVADNRLHRSFPAGLMALKIQSVTGEKKRFAEGSVYGYRKNGQDYRYVSEANSASSRDVARFYRIRAYSPVYVYSVHVGRSTRWYYSLTSVGAVRRLVGDNLAQDFPAHPALARAIDDDPLLRRNMGALDPQSGQMRVVELLAQLVR